MSAAIRFLRLMRRAAGSAFLVHVMITAAAGQPAAQTIAPAPVTGSDKAEALSEAARRGDAAAIVRLLDEGVDVNIRFRYSRTALSFAADRGHADVVKLLLDRGADVNIADTFYHATALTWAVNPAMGRKPQHAEVVRLLLQHGAQGKNDALLGAVSAPDAATTKVILDNGGIPAEVLTDALESALAGKQSEIAVLLERAGAKARPELTLDAAQLAKYTGTYRDSSPRSLQLIVKIEEGRLVGVLDGQTLTLRARDATTFGVVEQPGRTVTVRFDRGEVAAFTLGMGANALTFTPLERKER